MRRRASAYVQYTSASQTTTRNRIRRLTARFRPSFSIPNAASIPDQMYWVIRRTSEEEPAEDVPEREEHQNDDCHDDRHEGDHRQHRGAVVGGQSVAPG